MSLSDLGCHSMVMRDISGGLPHRTGRPVQPSRARVSSSITSPNFQICIFVNVPRDGACIHGIMCPLFSSVQSAPPLGKPIKCQLD